MLMAPPTRVISSFGGTTAMVPVWLMRALSSFSACDGEVPAAFVMSGAVNGVHPFAGSTNRLSSASSLPLLSRVVVPVPALAFAAVFCSVWPFALIR